MFKKNNAPWNKGKKMSEEARRNMSEAKIGKPSPMKGKHHSEESNRKNSDAHKGKIPWNKGVKTKISPPNKGKKASDETIKKLSESHMGITSGMKGKRHSEESNMKNSESHKNSIVSKANIEKMRGGNDVVEHHYIYDGNNPSKYTMKVTRKKHGLIHTWLRKAGIKVPYINEVI